MKRFMSLVLVVALLISMSTNVFAKDRPGGNDSNDYYDHIDVRQQGAYIKLVYVHKNIATGEEIARETVKLEATVVAVKSVSYSDVTGYSATWTNNFTGGDGYEFRKMGLELSKDLSASHATIVVDLQDNVSKEIYEDVTFTFGPEGCQAALEDCDGYRGDGRGGSVGLDFILGENDEGQAVYVDYVIPVKKVWNDGDNRDGNRPASIQVQLCADGTPIEDAVITLSAENNWEGKFEDIPEVAEDKHIVTYTIMEVNVPDGYEATVDGFVITNSYTPETVAVAGEKTWNDADDRDGIRPESITINLLADGVVIETVAVTEADGWTWSFTDLPKFASGEEIEYTITEEAVEGYTAEVNGYNVTNTHIPEVVTVEGSKTWVDNDNQDGLRPESITINLLADGTVIETVTVTEADGWAWTFENLAKYKDHGTEIVYTISEEAVEGYEAAVNGYDVTNTHTPETVEVAGAKTWNDDSNRDGKRPESITINLLADDTVIETVTVTEADGWAWSFTDLPKYAVGEEIKYTIVEDGVKDYTTVVNGYNVTNTHAPERMNLTVTKIWDDANDQDGKRPESIQVQLLANGEALGEAVTLLGEAWTFTWTDLYVYANGEEIVYTVEEVNVPDGYEATVNGFEITNTHKPDVTTVSGTKTWVDNNDQDGKRPESITINLLADGEEVKELTVTAEDGWAWTFADLPVYADGQEIVYTITEDAVEGYEATVEGFNVTNTHVSEVKDVTVTKTWNDNDNQDGIRPESIEVQLFANGEAYGEVVVLTGETWSYTWTDLAVYADGTEIIYTVEEVNVPEGYEATVNGYDIVNTHTPGTVSVDVKKVWNDNNDMYKIRPASITIVLLADGVETGATLKLNAEGGWVGCFADLPEYANGVKIAYTVSELKVEGYSTSVSGDAAKGFTVTNDLILIPETGDETNILLHGMVMGISFIALIGVFMVLVQDKKRYAK